MRKAFFLLHVAGVLVAADPPYFSDPIDGYHLPDFVQREKFRLVPGTLKDCTGSVSPTYSSYHCELVGTEAVIEAAGKTKTFSFDQLYASEYQYSPTEPSVMNYTFKGMYGETLPDGTLLETMVQLTFERKGATPNSLKGRLNLVSLNLGTAVVAEIKTPPAP